MQIRQLAASLGRLNLKILCKSQQLEPVDGGWGGTVCVLSEEINRSAKDKRSTHLSLQLRLADRNLQADYTTVVTRKGARRSTHLQGMLGNRRQIQTCGGSRRRKAGMGWDGPDLPTVNWISAFSHSRIKNTLPALPTRTALKFP